MSFLGRMNGWQQLWLLVSSLSFMSLGLIYPLTMVYRSNPGQEAYRQVLLKELRSEKCEPYINQPIAELREPPTSLYGVDCSAIYFGRAAGSLDIRPYSIGAYDAQQSARKLDDYYPLMAIFSCSILAASALLYALGIGIAWIRSRFNQTA
ncbi:hypothetical protein [Microvirga sp. VF16]|uniref:hypothetical protein n=1 Tax=Microvirga sp. VF16 TaxID=2807101 RepID=UPI00193D76A8|nr:hypothetical protein [Microvirga sp. VF16]QRM35653.1 hypothetical protein JO965_43315 [Microvirga sp. VF16]